nr:pilus assembly protein [uncultured Duganella sp.]
MSARRRQRRRPARGQAMVEFLVGAMFVLIPLFLAIVALGKLSDVQSTATMAARYAAWERTVWYEADAGFDGANQPNHKSAQQIGNEIAVRLINDRSAQPIKDTDKNANSFASGTDPLWRDNEGKAFLDTYAQLGSSVASEAPGTDIAGAVIGTLKSVSVKGLVGFVPPLPTDSLAVAQVSLKDIAKQSDAYQRLWPGADGFKGLDFSATGAVLSNTWGANASGGTRAMVATMVPTAQGLGTVVQAARAGLAPWDPEQVPRIEVGKIAVDVVPGDRLK